MQNNSFSLVFTSDTRGSKQRGRQGSGNDIALDIGSIAAAGERCIDKVVMVQETEYDDVITCKHSYSEKCHITYATDFSPTQEEQCEENFKKSCFIEYKLEAKDETATAKPAQEEDSYRDAQRMALRARQQQMRDARSR